VAVGRVKVLRVEHAFDGVGPYTGRGWLDIFQPPWLRDVAGGTWDPTPEYDRIGSIPRGEWLFGFQDIFQLFDWFGHRETFTMLRAKDFQAVEIFVSEEHVLFGGHQVVYKKDEATAKNVLNWDDMERWRAQYERDKLGIPT
jgi:hypothetical protein